MSEQLIALEFLHTNKYQPRHDIENQTWQAKLNKLAKSIEENATDDFDGLLQEPTAREIGDGHYELAFGHRRKAAFELLFNQGKSRYGYMRVNVRELTDEQMFDLAWDENEERENLNPVDEGEAYATYMREFNKTSKEAGARFKVAEETIRSKIRFGKAPETLKEKMRAGEINENAARFLLILTRVLPNNEQALLDTIKEISDGERPEEAVEQALRMSQNTKIITVNGDEDRGMFSTKAKTFKYLPELTSKAAMEALDWENNEWVQHAFAGYGADVADAINYFRVNVHYLAANPQPELLIEKLNHLIKPPACTACPLFAVIDGFGFCGWVACFDRKKAASEEAELHKVSETVGIAVYSKEDGAAKVISQWNEKHKALFTKKHADLRLRIPGSFNYNNFEGIPSHLQVVVVGKTLEALKKAEEKTAAAIESKHDTGINYETRRAMQQIRDAQISLFTWEQALPAFAKVLESVVCIDLLDKIYDELITGDFLETPEDAQLSDKELESMKKPARLALLRKRVVYKLLDSRMEYTEVTKIQGSKTPVVLFAKHLQELATTWGVKLPKDFLTKAAEHDEAVKLAIAELDKPDKDGAE